MALVRWDPFEELERLHHSLSPNFSLGRSMSAPVSDVYIESNTLVVEAHMPNFEEDEIDIQVHDGALEIRAQHSEKQEEKRKSRRYVMQESSSSFYRSIALPTNAEQDKISADFDKGVLKVTVPLTPKPEPKKISVKKATTK